jgi:hypothetical protein
MYSLTALQNIISIYIYYYRDILMILGKAFIVVEVDSG